MHEFKQTIWNQFLDDYATKTIKGVALGTAFAVGLASKHPGRCVAIFGGMGSGVAVDNCAHKFN